MDIEKKIFLKQLKRYQTEQNSCLTKDEDNKLNSNTNKIVHVDDEIIDLTEISIPIAAEGSANEQNKTFKNETETNLKDIISNNSETMYTDKRFEDAYPIEISLDVNYYSNLNDNREIIKSFTEIETSPNEVNNLDCDTLSGIKDFDAVLKEFQANNINKYHTINNNIAIPMPTLSESEFLLSSITSNEKIEISLDTASPVLMIPPSNDSDQSMGSDENPIIYNLDDYLTNPTRNNSTQLSPDFNIIDFENEDKGTFAEKFECQKSEIAEPQNMQFQIEFETFIQNSKEYTYSYDLFKEENKTPLNDDENMPISSSENISDSKLHSEDKIDIISISSTEDCKELENTVNDSDCEGYNSSDFEFIDEKEAYLPGFVISDSNNDIKNGFKNFVDEPGPSEFNSFNNFGIEFEEQYRKEHVIPENDDLLEFFSHPWNVYSFEAENKAFHSSKTMHVEIDNVGFNVGLLERRHEENKVDPVFEREAKENAKKIISMYPSENRRRRRRIF